jgi:hypothetical protein
MACSSGCVSPRRSPTRARVKALDSFGIRRSCSGPKKKQAALTAADVVAAVLGALSQSDALQATVATLESYLQTDENGQPVTFFVEPASIDVKVRGLVALILSSPEYQIA